MALIFQCQVKVDTGHCEIMDGPQQPGAGGGPVVAKGGQAGTL